MADNKEDFIDVQVDIGVLKTQVLTLSTLCNKMDQVIEKLVDQHDRHLTKVYESMDDQRKEKDNDIAEVHDRVDMVLEKLTETEKRILEEFQGLKKAMNDHSANSKAEFQKINQWKWTLAGGIIVITWLISRVGFDTLLKVLH